MYKHFIENLLSKAFFHIIDFNHTLSPPQLLPIFLIFLSTLFHVPSSPTPKQKIKPTKQIKPNKTKIAKTNKQHKYNMESALCWPTTPVCRAYQRVYLLYLVTLLWGKVIFPFSNGCQFQITSWLGVWLYVLFPSQFCLTWTCPDLVHAVIVALSSYVHWSCIWMTLFTWKQLPHPALKKIFFLITISL